MPGEYFVKITPNGQVFLPENLLRKLSLSPGDYVAIRPAGNTLELKKAESNPRARFEQITKEVEAQFQEEGLTPVDVEEAIQWARRQL